MSPGKYTWADVLRTAQEYIDRDDDLIYDIASDVGQIVGNIKHMPWFRYRVALALRDTLSKFANIETPALYPHQ